MSFRWIWRSWLRNLPFYAKWRVYWRPLPTCWAYAPTSASNLLSQVPSHLNQRTNEGTNMSSLSPVTCPITHLVAVDCGVFRPPHVPYSRARRTAVRCQSASVRCLLIHETLKDMASGRKTVAGDDTSQRQYTAPKGCGVGSRGTAMRLSCYARTTRADFRRSMLIVRGGWVYMATSADWPTYS